MKVKGSNSSVPALEKAQSVVDSHVSEQLVSEAFEVIFHEFERYIKIMKGFKGIDWSIYVRARNQMRKKGEAFEMEELPLFDEEDDSTEDSDKKSESGEEKKEGEEEKKEEIKEEGKKEESKAEASSPKSSSSKKGDTAEGGEDEKEEIKSNKSNKDGEEDGEDEEDDLEEKDKNEAIERQQERAKNEIKKISKLYSESFLRRLVRLVEVFTSISTVSAHPMSMV
jgi:hypothetical protein